MSHVYPQYPEDYKCEICGEEPAFTWWYRHGQVICATCGTTYQIKNLDTFEWMDPVIDIKEEWVSAVKAWWEDSKDGLGRPNFKTWIEANPEHKPMES